MPEKNGATTEHYHKCYYCGNELSEKPFNGSEEFDEDAVTKRDQIEEKNFNYGLEELEHLVALEDLSDNTSMQPTQSNIPKCPTCGSTNVNPISTTKKATGFILIGIFSSNFGKSYECRDCKYKW